MKVNQRVLSLFLAILIIAVMPAVTFAENAAVNAVFSDGIEIKFDVLPIIENGRTLVPIRAIFENMGMAVDWDENERTVNANGNGNAISLKIDETSATVNGETLYMDVPPRIIEGRTLVPLRFVSESVGAKVLWDEEKRIVNIYKSIKSDDKERRFPVTYKSEINGLGNVSLYFDYSDSYFVNGSGYTYNHNLARASIAAGISSWDKNELEAMYMDKLAVSDYKLYNYEKSLDDGSDKAAYSIAHKTLYDGRVLLMVWVRGANYGSEWKSNFHVGTGEYHKGFYAPASAIYEDLKVYAENHSIDLKSSRLWVTGYSRGAAIGNLLSGLVDNDIINGKEYFEGGSGVYSYLFAVPSGVDTAKIDIQNDVYGNIYNIILPYDIIPKVPMEEWGYGRFGKVLTVKNRNSNPQNANEKYFENLTKNMYKYSVGEAQTKAANNAVKTLTELISGSEEYEKIYENTIMDLSQWLLYYLEEGKSIEQFCENNNYQKVKEGSEFYKKSILPITETAMGLYAFLGIDISKIREDIIYPLALIMYENQFPPEKTYDVLVALTSFFVSMKPSLYGEITDAHNCEYYICWLFGYDNGADIYENWR